MENISPVKVLISPKISGIFKCFQCEFKCSAAVHLKEHYQIHRSEFPFKCFQCGYDGKDAEDFKQHSMTHFEQSYYKCPKCDYRAAYRQNITSHVRYTHKQICACCIEFKSKEEFCQHLIDHPECKENVELNDISLENRLQKSDQINRLGFEVTHQDEETSACEAKSNQVFVCQVCFYIFRSSEELDNHTINAHSEEHIAITTNEDSEGNSDSEQPSQQSNQDGKFFLCGECHFIYSSRKDLDEHLRTHQSGNGSLHLQETVYSPMGEMEEGAAEEVEYVCYICDKAFGSEKAVKLHMGHHTDIKFRCPKCGLSMKSQASLKTHLASHPQFKTSRKNEHSLSKKVCTENLYNCASCPYQTKFHDNLQMHLMTHSKRDPSKRQIKPTFKVRFGRK